MLDKVKEKAEYIITDILDSGINNENIDMLSKVIDIHKDMANEEYWQIKEENIMYRDDRYNDYPSMNYGARRRDSRGRYMEGSRNRRYRGHDMIDKMYDTYSTYMGDREEINRGNYGAKDDTMKSLEYMLQSAYDFMCMLSDDADSQEEVELIQRYARKMSEL